MVMRGFSTIRPLLCALALCLPACSQPTPLPSEPPAGLGVSWFHDDCAPWDGAATSLYLAGMRADGGLMPPYPHLRVSLYSSTSSFRVGQTLRFEGDRSNLGFAQYCESEERCLNATAVRIEFLKVEPKNLEGRLEVLIEGHLPLRGTFRATQIQFRALCG